MTELKLLSLGAGVQSTALLLLSAKGMLPKLDGAIFSDTGWEPKAVYDHLDRIEAEVAAPAGIPVYRVSKGSLRDDALDPAKKFAAMPAFVRRPDGSAGLGRRQCTNQYKLKPIKEQVRLLLGAERDGDGRVGRVRGGRSVEQWVGISTDEFHRAKDSGIKYIKSRFPLLEINWSRQMCVEFLADNGWGHTPKSACLGCPFHDNTQWRDIRDNDPQGWADVIEFDEAFRRGVSVNGADKENYLHSSLLPISEAPIDKPTRRELRGQQDELFSCSPWACKADDEAFVIDSGLEQELLESKKRHPAGRAR